MIAIERGSEDKNPPITFSATFHTFSECTHCRERHFYDYSDSKTRPEAISCLEARTGDRITDREMIHDLSLLGRQIEITVHPPLDQCGIISREFRENLEWAAVVPETVRYLPR